MALKQTDWSRAYNSKAYDRIYVTVPKGHKAEIEAAAAKTGESVNGLVNRLIDEYLKRIADGLA